MCSPKVSCASGTSVPWPTVDGPRRCHSAFSCSVQRENHKPSKRFLPLVQAISGFAPSAAGRWRPSRGSLLPRSGSAPHLYRSRLAHDTTLHTTKPLRASARSISLCLAVLQAWSFQLLQLSLRDSFLFYSTPWHCALSFALRRTVPTHLETTPPFHSIPIGPASAAGRLRSSRCIGSAPEHLALLLILLLLRASDTALRLIRTYRRTARNCYQFIKCSLVVSRAQTTGSMMC